MILSSLILISAVAAVSQAAADLAARHELLLDDQLIASKQNVVRRLHSAEKYPAGPVLRPTEPWEANSATIYGSVIRDGQKYRMWYLVGKGNVGYAESPDGITWTKPALGMISLDGRPTNLVLQRAGVSQPGTLPNYQEMFGVFRDDRDPDPSRRYKMGFLSVDPHYQGPRADPFHRGQRRGLGVACSPDGLHWTLADNWATEAICDGASHWMWDPARGKYVLFGRTKHLPPELLDVWNADDWVRKHFWGRVVARVESADFLHWDIVDPGKAPIVMASDAKDPPGTEIYSMLVFPYQTVYLGLVQVFQNRADTSRLDIQLAVSRDGVHFQRVAQGEPFLPCGDIGCWDRFNQSLACNPPILEGDSLRIYYGGRQGRHPPYQGPDRGRQMSCIGLATVRADRFVSLGASFDGGQVITKPLRLKGKTLHLNAKCDFGEILVEVLDASGKVCARSKALAADALDLPVVWQEGGLPDGPEPVTLRVTLRNAIWFSFWST